MTKTSTLKTMNNDEHILQQKQSERIRPVGRPVVNPFRNKDVEEDFYLRAEAVVKLAYDHSPENTKKPFVLAYNCRMGKTAFWAFIYYYYTLAELSPEEFYTCPIHPMEYRPLAEDNLDHFLNLLKARVGEEVVGSRPAILKRVQAYKSHKLSHPRMEKFCPRWLTGKLKTYRKQYEIVLKVWKNIIR